MKRVISIVLLGFSIFFCCFTFGCYKDNKRQTNDSTYENDTYLSDKINKINEIRQDNSIIKQFFFITDLHWTSNSRKSPELIQTIRAETNIDNIVFCGDYIGGGYNNKEVALSIMTDCVTSFNMEKYVAILGNHDINTIGNPKAERINDVEAIKVLNQNRFEKPYFSIDEEGSKIGCVFLDTNCFERKSDQYQWLVGKLQSYQSDWTVLIFMHEYNEFASAGICIRKGEKGKLLDSLLQENQESIKCSFAGIFNGHTHRDYFDYNSLNYPIISTTCDAVDVYDGVDNLYIREKGKITEQAFDVVQVDTSQRKVFLTRIGAGVDRTYFY